MLETSAIVFWDRERTGRGSLYLWSLCTSFFHYLLHFLFLSFSYMYFVPCCSPPASVLSSVHPSAILISNATEQISTKFGKVGFSTECWRTSFFLHMKAYYSVWTSRFKHRKVYILSTCSLFVCSIMIFTSSNILFCTTFRDCFV